MNSQSQYFERSASHLFKRCVQCPQEAPSCPQCKPDELCTTTIGDCYSCSSAKCVKTTLSGSTNASNSLGSTGPNVAAIAGGVAAGIVVIIVAAFCLWKYVLKGKRVQLPPDAYYDEDLPEEKPVNKAFGQLRDARSSTHTVNSLASTVLTRASNVIQIAYIPGVTQRNHNSPGMLVPPVPPIPMPTGQNQPTQYEGEQLFFKPLRDSQWSDSSSMMTNDIRKSVASSLARSSIGTTIYQDNALANPMPAMPSKGKVNVVSVKSGSSAMTTPSDSPASQNGEFMAHKANYASSAASRPVIVKMLGGSDAFKAKSTLPPVSTAKSMKPISLNIMKKGTTTPASMEGSATAGASPSASPATTLVNTPDRPGRPIIGRPEARLSIADSIDTTAPHSRARLSIAHSHRTLGDETSDDDDEDESHERSRQSLLVRDQGPFGDEAEVHTPASQRRSPFDDNNRL